MSEFVRQFRRKELCARWCRNVLEIPGDHEKRVVIRQVAFQRVPVAFAYSIRQPKPAEEEGKVIALCAKSR